LKQIEYTENGFECQAEMPEMPSRKGHKTDPFLTIFPQTNIIAFVAQLLCVMFFDRWIAWKLSKPHGA
jgi:hypothetical protein